MPDKILLVAGIPPCSNYTGGLVLEQLCSFMDPSQLCVVSVLDPNYRDAKLSPRLANVPHLVIRKPNEFAFRPFSGLFRPRESKLPSAGEVDFDKIPPDPEPSRLRIWMRRVSLIPGFLRELKVEKVDVKRIAREIAQFAKEQRVTKLWIVLEGQTLIRLAAILPKMLKVPLYTEVWDPPSWWIKDRRIDRYTGRRILETFDRVLSESVRCGVASLSMASEYQQLWEVESIPFLPSVKKELMKPSKRWRSKRTVSIVMAGQQYASREFLSLLYALDRNQWHIDGIRIVLRLVGRKFEMDTSYSRHVEFMGWREVPELIPVISESDIGYCPYWFDRAFEMEARLSFPSKITTYLAAGIPVFFHGPRYASPSRFIKMFECGLCCHSMNASQIITSLRKMLGPDYDTWTSNGNRVFQSHLTEDHLRESFQGFLQ